MKAGEREIIARERFIILDGECADFTFIYKETPIHIVVEFKALPVRDKIGTATWIPIEGGSKITFKTISNTPVVSSDDSLELGSFEDGNRLVFFAEFYRYASTGVISLQLMTKENPNATKI
jgi:hypothetical protein